MTIQIEDIVPSASQATDRGLVRRGSGPLDYTIELIDFADVATSGSASDLASGTLPAARFDDTAHGSRAGGALHANVVASGDAGFMTGADKAKLDGIEPGAQVNVATDLTYTAATRILASSTGTDATLPLFTNTEAGLVPASGGGSANFLSADGTFAVPQIADGDKGDITVSGTGSVWTLDANIKFGLPLAMRRNLQF